MAEVEAYYAEHNWRAYNRLYCVQDRKVKTIALMRLL